jgi:hypothetical protein
MSEPVSETARRQLTELHALQLRLHKVLMDAERSAYEDRNGSVSPNQLLQLLLADPQFAWLRTLSQMLADIDEVLSTRRPGTDDQAKMLLRHARSLLTAKTAPQQFQEKYQQAMQENAEVVVLHGRIRKLLESFDDDLDRT